LDGLKDKCSSVNLVWKRGRLINKNSEFSSSKALEMIDRRTASDMPWWAEAADSTSSDDAKKDQSNNAIFNKEESESKGAFFLNG
jgi:hypothetical protein